MNRSNRYWVWLLLTATSNALADGVSAYLPLHLEPGLEAQIERALILADQPVLKRPISVAMLQTALPRICEVDAALCQSLENSLAILLQRKLSIRGTVEAAASEDNYRVVPNRYGLDGTSPWFASAQVSWQPNDYVLASAGVVAYEGELNPSGSTISFGTDKVQVDIGYRAHWLSSLTDSSFLIGTEAPTMPTLTLSNNMPMTRLGFRYEVFLSEMSRSSRIVFRNGLTTGRPQLAGAQLSIEPARGWTIGVNRLMQFGGGARGGQSAGDLFRAFFRPGRFDNVDSDNLDNQFGNQVASITSSFIFPTNNPITVYFEYAGEDTSRARSYLLGNSALAAGIRFPMLAERFDLTLEASEWQNGWYVNGLYGDGLTNRGRVLGHWGADARLIGDSVGAQSAVARLGWSTDKGSDVEIRYRSLRNESYGARDYDQAHEFSMRYSRVTKSGVIAGTSFDVGRDVFGESYGRLAGYLQYANGTRPYSRSSSRTASNRRRAPGSDWFVEAGLASNRVTIDLDDNIPRFERSDLSPHLAIGVRRQVSSQQDLGARIELDQVDGHWLTAVRALDYRYRFQSPLAVSFFAGAARYDLATPAYGLWGGAGVAWRDVFPSWDVGLDFRFGIKVARDDLVAADPVGGRPDSFYDIQSATLSITRRF